MKTGCSYLIRKCHGDRHVGPFFNSIHGHGVQPAFQIRVEFSEFGFCPPGKPPRRLKAVVVGVKRPW
jgi:hypothetical protein